MHSGAFAFRNVIRPPLSPSDRMGPVVRKRIRILTSKTHTGLSDYTKTIIKRMNKPQKKFLEILIFRKGPPLENRTGARHKKGKRHRNVRVYTRLSIRASVERKVVLQVRSLIEEEWSVVGTWLLCGPYIIWLPDYAPVAARQNKTKSKNELFFVLDRRPRSIIIRTDSVYGKKSKNNAPNEIISNLWAAKRRAFCVNRRFDLFYFEIKMYGWNYCKSYRILIILC